MGASNWFFSNTDSGAKVSSVMHTLAQNAKLTKINEMDYLWALLDRGPYCPTEKDCQKLLPWNIDLSDNCFDPITTQMGRKMFLISYMRITLNRSLLNILDVFQKPCPIVCPFIRLLIIGEARFEMASSLAIKSD
jgi:hypothetical protein